jgi:hypothetical protein
MSKKLEMTTDSILWEFDNLETIGGRRADVLGNPSVIETSKGHAIAFDGKMDAILLNTNPLAGVNEFTIEIVFRPDKNGLTEQRFFHIHEKENRRVLLEIRLIEPDKWVLDSYIRSDQSGCTLFCAEATHPVGKWYHAALVYKNGTMSHYVNLVKEATGIVNFNAMTSGVTSIGCRLNRVFWYKGAIRSIRISHEALSPELFYAFHPLRSVQ